MQALSLGGIVVQLGLLLVTYRERGGFSRRKLGARAGCSAYVISGLESGAIKLRPPLLDRIAAALGLNGPDCEALRRAAAARLARTACPHRCGRELTAHDLELPQDRLLRRKPEDGPEVPVPAGICRWCFSAVAPDEAEERKKLVNGGHQM